MNHTGSSGPGMFGWPRYKVSIGQVAPEIIRNDITSFKKCILGVRLGHKNLEKARLEACVEWISENFESCAVAIGDSIYRHNLQLTHGLTPSAAETDALQKGQDFIDTYRPLFEQYGNACNFEFMLSSQISKSASFDTHLEQLKNLYEQNESFKRSVGNFAQAYLDKGDLITDGFTEANPRQKQLGNSSLFEELALFAFLRQNEWPVLVYPGSIKPIQEIADGKHPEAPDALKKLAYATLRQSKERVFFVDESVKPAVTPTASAEEDVSRPENLEFLPDFQDEEWEKLISYTEARAFKSGDVIIEYGQDDRSMYILANGSVEILLHDPKDGSKKRINTMDKGTVFGELALLDGRPRSATVSAMTNGYLFQLSLEKFEELQNQAPAIACALLIDIARVLSIRNRDMNERIQNLTSI